MFNMFKSKKRRILENIVRTAVEYNNLAAMKKDIESRNNLLEEEIATLEVIDEGLAAMRFNLGLVEILKKDEAELNKLMRELGI